MAFRDFALPEPASRREVPPVGQLASSGERVVPADSSDSRPLAERLLAAQYAITSILATSITAQQAVPRLLNVACTVTGWEYGEYWRYDLDTQELRWAGVWHQPRPEFEEFARRSEGMALLCRGSLPHTTLEGQTPRSIGDVTTSEGFRRREEAKQCGLRAAFAFPIRSAGRETGVLTFFSTRADAPGDELSRLLEALGHQIGEFIEARRAEGELWQTLEALRSLYAVTTAPGLAFEQRKRALLELGCERFGMPVAIVSQIEGDRYRVVDCISDCGTVALGDEFALGETICRRVVEARTLLQVTDCRAEALRHPALGEHELGSFLGIPLFAGEQIVGTLSFISREPRSEPIRASARELLKLMAQWLGGELTQRRADAEVLRAAAWFTSLIAAAQDGLVSIDREGKVVDFNPAAERIFGYRRDEIVGETVNLLMPEPHAAEHNEYIRRYEHGGEARAIGRIRTVNARRKNGEIFPIELSVAEVTVDRDKRYGAFIRDISDKVRMQRELIERERLASIGTMTAMLAHEVGNPLNSMYLHAQILERRMAKMPETRGSLGAPVEALQGEIRRLRRLLDDFRTVSRREILDRRQVSLDALLGDVVAALAPDMAQCGVQMQTDVDSHVAPVALDYEKIKQVLVNLCKNAAEAMPEGGSLTLRAHSRPDEVTIEVEDTGPGIPEGFDVFEPFATTKTEGTGLGLPISRRLIAAHGGILTHASSPGKGTIFAIRIPLAVPSARDS